MEKRDTDSLSIWRTYPPAKREQKGGVHAMENDMVEIPQIHIPDEVTQVDRPEIGETTPHPKPESPLASSGTAELDSESDSNESSERIGFIS